MARILSVIGLTTVVGSIGCQQLSTTPNSQILAHFGEVDRLAVLSSEPERHITDKRAIQHLRDIYRRADWEPFMDTVPGDMVDICAYQGDKELFRLSFGANWLIERSPDGEFIRKGILNEEDEEWLRSLVDGQRP